ncbi:MAG: DUF3971 domain-containing protein, partial [Pseudomonadota bacterium]
MTQEPPSLQPQAPAPRQKRNRRIYGPTVLGRGLTGLFSMTMSLLTLSLVVLAAAIFFSKGREIPAPDWLMQEISTRVQEATPDMVVTFDEVVAVLGDGWRPELRVRNLDVRTPANEEIVRFSNVSVGVDPMALLEQRFALTRLRAEGVFVTMRRSAGGAISIQTSADIGSARREVANLAQFIREVDDVLLQPALVPLREVNVQAITLRYEDARANRAWTIDGGRMSMLRDGRDLSLSTDIAILGGSSGVAAISANYAGIIGETQAEFGFTLANLDARDIASQSPAFSWLSALQAPISGALRGGVDDAGNLRPLSASLQIGAGFIQPTAEALPVPIESAQSYFTYFPADQRLNFSQFEIDTQWGRGSLQGYAKGTLGPSGQVTDLIGQFQLNEVSANPAGFYDEPVEIAAAELDFRLTLSPFALELGRLEIIDEGSRLTSSATVAVDAQGWRVAGDAEIDEISAARVRELWPEHVKEKTRRWIGENVRAGTVTDAKAAVRLAQGTRPRVYLAFEFDDAEVRFLRDMPLISNARGHGSLVEDRFVILVDDGGVEAPEGGRVDVAGSSFIVPDTSARPDTPAVVRLVVDAPVTAGLSLLDQPPLEIMRKTPFPVDLASGQVSAEATLSLPLKKGLPVEDVRFDVIGTVRDVESALLVPDRVVTADSLTLRATEKGVSLGGFGALDGIPLDVVWQQPIGPVGKTPSGGVTGTVQLTPSTLDTIGVNLPPGTVRGSATAALRLVTERGAAPRLLLNSDLKGLSLSVPELGWGKPAMAEASLEVEMSLGDSPQVERVSLTAPGLFAEGSIELTETRQLERVRLDRVRIGRWLNARVDLTARGAGAPLAISLRGGTLDLRELD